jgi:hypothetical protein
VTKYSTKYENIPFTCNENIDMKDMLAIKGSGVDPK